MKVEDHETAVDGHCSGLAYEWLIVKMHTVEATTEAMGLLVVEDVYIASPANLKT